MAVVVNVWTSTKRYGIRILFIRRAAIVRHAVTQSKVGFLQFFITPDNISKIFPADTPRTPLPIWVVAGHKPERAAVSFWDGLGFVGLRHCSNSLYCKKGGSAWTGPILAWQKLLRWSYDNQGLKFPMLYESRVSHIQTKRMLVILLA